MSDNTDWTLIVRASQQAKVAAEAAVASARLLESEAGHRLAAMEGRLGAIEGRIANLALGQTGHEQAIMRIADTQADHTARLTRMEAGLTNLEARLAGMEVRLTGVEALLEARLTPIETVLTAQTGQLTGVEIQLTRIEALLTGTAGKRDG